MARPVDPMRRTLPLAEWPQVDQDAWAKAQTTGDIFDEGGRRRPLGARDPAHQRSALWPLARLSLWTGDWTRRRSGRPGHPRGGPRLQPPSRGARRPAHAPVDAGRSQGDDAGDGADRTWRWLQDACNRVQISAKPSRDKRARMRPTAEIVAAALAELERLPAEALRSSRALAYRDALMLALLAARPLRVKNFTALGLGRHLVRPGR